MFGSEAVKIEGAGLLVSQVSGETHSAATDTPGVCEGEGREESRQEDRKERERGVLGHADMGREEKSVGIQRGTEENRMHRVAKQMSRNSK